MLKVLQKWVNFFFNLKKIKIITTKATLDMINGNINE